MKVLQQGSNFNFIDSSISVSLMDTLPIGIFDVIGTPFGLQLKKREINNFEDIPKTYGKLPNLKEKLSKEIHFYDKLGILLIGEKGSGKSLLAKQLCNNSNLPILIVKDEFDGADLSSLLNSIPNKFILFIDEFEKLFSTNDREKKDPQDKLLSVLDGNDTSKFISILTANNEHQINSCLKNRTKRIKYYIEFETLNQKDIEEVLIDMKINQEIHNKIINIHRIVGQLNYDVLMEIINEFIRYPEYTLEEILYYLNIEISEMEYTMDVYCKLDEFTNPILSKKIECNPYLSIDMDFYPRLNGQAVKDCRDSIINIYEDFSSDKYTIVSVNDSVILELKEEFIKVDVNFGKMRFILTPYFNSIKLAI